MPNQNPKTKCGRTVCKRRSTNPEADGWVWVEVMPPLKTGWWCPQCTEGLHRTLAAHGVKPQIERLN
jgi:hypothetical protein